MKRLLLLVLIVSSTAFSQGIEFRKERYAEVLKMAKEQNKLVFIDIYTSWCGPCKHMADNIFPLPKVGEYYNTYFLNLQLDAEKSEDGKMVAKSFGVSAYPTFLFVNGDGELVYRFLGGKSEDMFIKEGEKAVEAFAALPELKKYTKEYEKGNREKEFLKNTISDISHQLKTPLAALNIYNGLLQDEDIEVSSVKEFADLSEQELDRIETLVQSLLKITRLDAGDIVLERTVENVADMMQDTELHFAYRARQEKKEIILTGSDQLSLFCDRDWLSEAIDNIVKNAFDHTKSGATICITWKELPSGVQIVIKDNGCGIHPEDIHHIFKRFYRSRFSKDKQGIGLGLSLTKAIVEAHNGTIEVDSELGIGTIFTMNFLIPTKM